jgi:uncharacterized protein YeaO (DUF488 family)
VALDVRRKRVSNPSELGDGYRILIDRLWPRDVSRERARPDEARELAPSDGLHRWLGHDPKRLPEFPSAIARSCTVASTESTG